MNIRSDSRPRRGGFILLALAGAGLAGCDGLTDVAGDPHKVDASKPLGLGEALIGATVDLYFAYDSYIVIAGMLGDEFVSSGTASGYREMDARNVTPRSTGGASSRGRGIGGEGSWTPQQKAVFAANLVQERIEAGDFPGVDVESPQYARASLFDGLAKTWIADMFCSAAFNGEGPEYSSQDVYSLAEAEFTKAIDATGAESEIVQAALVGRARVRLNIGNRSGALADALLVDPDFELTASYSTNTFEQRNRVWWRTWGFGNFSIDFRVWSDLTIDNTGDPDPRLELALNPRPAYEPNQDLWAPLKAEDPAAPLVLASGDEAQMIIAEIQLGQDAVDAINAVRARNGIATAWAPATLDDATVLAKVIDERGRNLFLEGVRNGDLRRYLDQYGIDLWTRVTPQGVEAMDAVCYPLPDVERENNPGI
ncbi:MAG TPA: RagB/SusD family nutrient uptake outer membrane protein [Longimicrobiales bacterium]|nr:RagB/SusD family nutrient uptake outer membrane protein [Longimicrobiales bacterium]